MGISQMSQVLLIIGDSPLLESTSYFQIVKTLFIYGQPLLAPLLYFVSQENALHVSLRGWHYFIHVYKYYNDIGICLTLLIKKVSYNTLYDTFF